MKQDKFYIDNRKIRYNYFWADQYQAGIVLKGSEVLSIRERKTNISEAYCVFVNNELYIRNMHITNKNIPAFGHQEIHDRKLLLTKKELRQIKKFVQIKGNAIIPKCVIVPRKGYIKVEICLCKGKHNYDKRETIKQRDLERYGRN